ncbi:hypothetical protein [Fimbriiglobus ruber]|uniref:Uncharacterized protein n=1 Tax=Fimbriiglobus ruber TaxID=1908690 RepID=A0A225E183_9BACT|nr:hypothetical protein [Fimbriiglobus ruber]OWK43249.1 hypothetical protein FRUB_02848 [Fimbriiglobus ruber]
MISEFNIQGPTRLCAASGRELLPGDRFYAVLTDEDGKFVRRDFAADAWAGPPAGAVAFWVGRVPASNRPRKPTFNDELLIDCFNHLAGTTDPDRLNFRYVVALLLMRRKRLKFEDAQTVPGGTPVLVVRDARTGARHEVADPRLSEAEIVAVQDEVFKVLGWE